MIFVWWLSFRLVEQNNEDRIYCVIWYRKRHPVSVAEQIDKKKT